MSTGKAVIVNELLAFIQNAIDTMDEISILQICKSNFKEEEICSGKALIFQTLGKTAQMPSRRRDGGERSLQDIITVLKETDPDDVPDFVARELHKLPPVGFDHVDVTRLLKDITFLKASLVEVQARLEASDNTISGLRAELVLLRNTNSVFRSPEASNNVNTRRGALNASVCSFKSADFAESLESPVAVSSAANVSPRAAARCPAPSSVTATAALHPAPSAPHVPSPATTPISASTPRGYAAAAASKSNKRQSTTNGGREIRKPPRSAVSQGPQKTQEDDEGFIRVEKKKKKVPHRRNQCGTAPTGPNHLLRPALPMTLLYVSRLHFATKPTDLVEYMKVKTNVILRVEKLHSHNNVSFNSFVVRVPTSNLALYMKEDFWPKGVIFRRFRGRLGDTPPLPAPNN